MKLNINGIDKEVSKETCAFAVTEYFAKHPEPKPEPPKLRHGDYGLWSFAPYDENTFVVYIDSGDSPDTVFYDGCQYCSNASKDDGREFTRLGNLYDDLARNKVDLEEFEVELEYDENLKFELKLHHAGRYICLIQTMTSGKTIHAHIDIKQAPEIHQKLGQMIAYALREQAKKKK